MTKHKILTEQKYHGVLGEFDSTDQLLFAVNKARQQGFLKMDAYSPFAVHGLAEALGHRPSKLLAAVFCGGCIGTLTGFGLQYWVSVIAYPYNIGGRPMNSWVSFIPIIFELTVLFAAFTAVFGMIARNGLPKPYHPVFRIDRFAEASRDKFFFCIEATDAKFHHDHCQQLMKDWGATNVFLVEA